MKKKLIDARQIKKGDHFRMKGEHWQNPKSGIAKADAFVENGMVHIDLTDDGQDGISVDEGDKVWLLFDA